MRRARSRARLVSERRGGPTRAPVRRPITETDPSRDGNNGTRPLLVCEVGRTGTTPYTEAHTRRAAPLDRLAGHQRWPMTKDWSTDGQWEERVRLCGSVDAAVYYSATTEQSVR